jgi:hypothetical protein
MGEQSDRHDEDSAVARRMRNERKRRKRPDPLNLENDLREASTKGQNVRPLDAGPSRQETIAIDRNQNRIEKADERDRATLLSKYLPSSAALFLPPPVEGPEDSFRPPPDFHRRLREVAQAQVPTPKAPNVQFATDASSLEQNRATLELYDYNLGALFAANKGTTLDYGSEFRPIDQLRKVLGGHPLFPELTEILSNGMDYRYSEELTEDERMAEVSQMTERGNHQSAENEPERVKLLLGKDVTHGFSLPVPLATIPSIPGALVQPFRMTVQWTLDDKGSRVPKYRLLQDLSFSLSKENASVNSRIDMGAYNEMIYGWCLSRIIHYVLALRQAYPLKRIFVAKYDYSDAYRRMNHAASAAAQSIAVFDGVAYIALRLTFGGSPNPPTWCLFSELVTDLANEISLCREWDHETLRSPAQPETPEPVTEPDRVPIAPARPLAVHIPVGSTAQTDGFIDDLITVALDTERNNAREAHTVPLAIHVTSRPHAGDDEPITRRSILAQAKLIAEGTPAEIQIVLGWLLDTRRLSLSLPEDKHTAWKAEILQILADRSATFGDLDSTVGRLNHAAYVIPLSRHFLNRVRERVKRRRPKKQRIDLQQIELDDLRLWLEFLDQAKAGISLNRIAIRQPTRLSWSDACPYGIGGYNLHGFAWRIRIPSTSPLFGDKRFNNLFEFIGMAVNVWIECLDTSTESECILAIGDNTSAIGWLFSSGKMPTDSLSFKAVQVVARKVARLILGSEHCLASQHIKGELNVVSDLLSFEGGPRGKPHPLAFDEPDDELLTSRFHEHLSTQIPRAFRISRLPREILSWITLVLRIAELSVMPVAKPQTKTRTAPGDGGSPSASPAASGTTPSSLLYPHKNSSSSSSPSSASIELLRGMHQVDLQGSVSNQWSAALCATPQAVWLRRFGTITSSAPFTSKGAPTCSPPSAPSSRPTTTSTPRLIDKRPLPPSCFGACTPPPGLTPSSCATPYPPQLPTLPSAPSFSPCAPASSPQPEDLAGRKL